MAQANTRVEESNGVDLDGQFRRGNTASQKNGDLVTQKIAQLERQMEQMNMQQQVQMHDLQCGNHDLAVAVQSIGALAQPLSAMSPFLNTIMAEMAELCIEKNADYAFCDYEITITNEDE